MYSSPCKSWQLGYALDCHVKLKATEIHAHELQCPAVRYQLEQELEIQRRTEHKRKMRNWENEIKPNKKIKVKDEEATRISRDSLKVGKYFDFKVYNTGKWITAKVLQMDCTGVKVRNLQCINGITTFPLRYLDQTTLSSRCTHTRKIPQEHSWIDYKLGPGEWIEAYVESVDELSFHLLFADTSKNAKTYLFNGFDFNKIAPHRTHTIEIDNDDSDSDIISQNYISESKDEYELYY
jgi:hypothetical protein